MINKELSNKIRLFTIGSPNQDVMSCEFGNWFAEKVERLLDEENESLRKELKAIKDVYNAFTNPDTASVDAIYKLTSEILDGRKENQSLRKELDIKILENIKGNSVLQEVNENNKSLRTRLNGLVEGLENAKVYGAVVWFGDDTEGLTPCIFESHVKQLIQKANGENKLTLRQNIIGGWRSANY